MNDIKHTAQKGNYKEIEWKLPLSIFKYVLSSFELINFTSNKFYDL